MRKFVVLATLFLGGCFAKEGPWLWSTQEQRDELLISKGMTVKEIQEWKGRSLREKHLNPKSRDSYMDRLPDDYTGIGYWLIEDSHCLEIVRLEKGVVVEINYGRNGSGGGWGWIQWQDRIYKEEHK